MGGITSEEIAAIVQRAKCIHSEAEVEEAIDILAEQIRERLGDKNPILLCVMNGGFILTAGLATRLQFPLQLDYVHATRYREETSGAELQWKSHPSIDMEGRVVIVVDDIFDEGITLEKVVSYCTEQNVAKVYTAVLINKIHNRKQSQLKVDFIGLEIEDLYLYGYGMDYKGYLRNAAGIFAIADEDK